jgi:molybdate transport system substrate-binding protein
MSTAKVNSLSDLTQGDVKTIGLANPDLAPYGLASREALQHAGIWAQVEKKVVYAENISMARQYGVTGNADAVFTAYSLLTADKGKIIQVDEKLHAPIDQALGIVKASAHQAEARQFVEFLLRGKGRDILGSSGYRVRR